MRGYLQPSLRPSTTELQDAFRAMSRGRRSKLAEAANVTLLAADQWARGGAVDSTIAGALSSSTQALVAKRK